MSNRELSEEKNIRNALISALSNLESTPTRELVEQKAKGLAALFDYNGDLKNIISDTLIAVETRMGEGVSLIDTNAVHDDQWLHKRSDIDWIYSKAYFDFLESEGWAPRLTQTLSDVTGRILGHLQDPKSEGTTWSRRGLVIGHVQSGKTANYTGVIARAADAGYKLIIVIAGIHNNLRKQTQERIDEAFIGRSSDPKKKRMTVGVGLQKGYPHPATLTNVIEDFNSNTAAKSGWKINDFSKPIILVIKKNVSTLDALYGWLADLNANGHDRITDVPMLLIDDEADNASINTNKEDVDPTRTNATIRRILALFAKSCYVGYTATPFANIFINPEIYGEGVLEELFPRDFIYCLDAPSTYFGANKVFLNEESSDRVLRHIDDAEKLLPLSHKGDFVVSELPDSLYAALDSFIIARAIRNLRGQRKKHCSMMVNVSRFVTVQRQVREFLRTREMKIRSAVEMYALMPDESALGNAQMQALKKAFDTEYSGAGLTWQEVKRELVGVFEHMHMYVINSDSDEVLDYKKYSDDSIGLTAIAVGGLSLSRGLTVEGLTTSYMYRSTKMYDTLMQMGRWFGYRPGFEDLCRVHLSRDSIDWYAYIANAADELVLQVKRMRRDGLSPRQFGLYVKDHPDALSITAANKMRTGKEVVVKQNYSGLLKESHWVSVDEQVNRKNFELIERLWRQGFGGRPAGKTEKGVIFEGVDVSVVDDFLTSFQTHRKFEEKKKVLVDYLRAVGSTLKDCDVLLISPGGVADGGYALNVQERAAQVVEAGCWLLSKDRVASRGDEGLGLTDEQVASAIAAALDSAEDQAKNGKTEKSRARAQARVAAAQEKKTQISDVFYREQRGKPLLMIHSLMPTGNEELKEPIAAFGLSFPPGDYGTSISVIANRVWVEAGNDASMSWEEEEEVDA